MPVYSLTKALPIVFNLKTQGELEKEILHLKEIKKNRVREVDEFDDRKEHGRKEFTS